MILEGVPPGLLVICRGHDPAGQAVRWMIPLRRSEGGETASRGRFEWQPLEPVKQDAPHVSAATHRNGAS